MPMKTKISYACINAKGKIRTNNEDNFCAQGRFRGQNETEDIAFSNGFAADGKEILAVFDGMGGEECGEVASFLAASNLEATFEAGGKPKEALTELCRALNRKVCAYANENGISSMGSTAVGVLFGKKAWHAFNVGDSRAYLLRDGELRQLTRDHSAPSPGNRKGPLLQYLGLPEEEFLLEPSCQEMDYRNKDRILICSDGLTDMMKDEEIQEILGGRESLEKLSSKLFLKALENGGRDNVTLMLCQVKKSLF